MKIHTILEVAKILNTSQESVRRFLVNGDLEGSKLGGSWRVKETQIIEFYDRCSNVNRKPAKKEAWQMFLTIDQLLIFHFNEIDKFEKISKLLSLTELHRKSLYLKIIQYHEEEIEALNTKKDSQNTSKVWENLFLN